MSTERLYKSDEVAKRLRKNRQTILRYTREGKLCGSRPGGKEYLYSEQQIDDFVNGRTPAVPEPEPKPARNPRKQYAS